ncbi:MAG: hypothetical protein H7Y37_17020 [Anaerolineae bacterium]|nr:hypothetical protein [Gloeobacterales cyanobacterium ES-bin-313]
MLHRQPYDRAFISGVRLKVQGFTQERLFQVAGSLPKGMDGNETLEFVEALASNTYSNTANEVVSITFWNPQE